MWQWINIKVLKGKQPGVLYSAKIFLSVFEVGGKEHFCLFCHHFLRKEMMKMLIINRPDPPKNVLKGESLNRKKIILEGNTCLYKKK